MKWIRLLAIAGGLGVWYTFASPDEKQLSSRNYPLPDEIKVVKTTLPFEERERVWISENKDGTKKKQIELEKIVKTEDIDFTENFSITTEDYRLVRGDDWLPTRYIGHVLSCPTKLFFWDWDAGLGLDEDKSRAVLSMLEEKDINNITVRINHNEVWYDCYRLFFDQKVEDRNNFLARGTVGLLSTFIGELFAETRRGDYYNPMTQTAVLYSNIESVSAHEIGHHMDFQRFNSDWEYSLVRPAPPVMLYQEWQASQNAKNKLLEKQDEWQFNRYLFPAFFTYLIAGYYASKKLLQKKEHRENGIGDFKKLEVSERPKVHSLQTLRYFGTMNTELYAGIAAFNATSNINEYLGYGAFLAGAVGISFILNKTLKQIIPYNFE